VAQISCSTAFNIVNGSSPSHRIPRNDEPVTVYGPKFWLDRILQPPILQSATSPMISNIGSFTAFPKLRQLRDPPCFPIAFSFPKYFFTNVWFTIASLPRSHHFRFRESSPSTNWIFSVGKISLVTN